MLLLPRADKLRLASPSHAGISFCRWRGSLQCIDAETQRPESLAPFNLTFQFAFGDGRQYWGTADLCSNWILSNLPESLEKLWWVKTSLNLETEKISCWKTSLVAVIHTWVGHAAHPCPPPPQTHTLYCRRDSQSTCLGEHLSASGSDGEARLMARGGWRWGGWGAFHVLADWILSGIFLQLRAKTFLLNNEPENAPRQGHSRWVDSHGQEIVPLISISHWQALHCEDNCGFVALRDKRRPEEKARKGAKYDKRINKELNIE